MRRTATKQKAYLFDTHALIFWANRSEVSEEFIKFFDKREQQGTLYISSITFWEMALLVQKGKLSIVDTHIWKDNLLSKTNLRHIDPSASEMIDSTLLPFHHKDPFDRLLIAQANFHNLTLVTRDRAIQTYEVSCMWM